MVGLAGLVGFWGTSLAGKGASGLSSSAGTSSLSSLADTSSSSSLML